ncbi:MAG: hypothetical protein AVDCRST_MAG74-2821 [uncultured Pyrinomonadaceae bacterium]|uniref:DUF1501 domain-containing protein n=1 Tax=uncultured Pyrinomonadaceae bacterium TaxID=2283094 RepID=A0A6J4PQ27_9BACT|nr:MAG: hypothetical protein AVDCRST_MAG74-2821 [uncultured Pyrinomonadaceae bacterium]
MKQDRREFIKKSGCALGMAAIATQVEHFGLMTALAQKTDDGMDFNPPSDYRALVCVFMAGGNDGNNTVIPNHSDTSVSNYQSYSAARSAAGLALAQNTLLPISVPRMNNLTYGLNPNLGVLPLAGTTIINNGIHELWAQGKMAIATNVGTLVAPMTRAQYQSGSIRRPFQLFSHSDQVSQYQGGRADTPVYTGWGGRVSDLRTAPDNPGGLVPMITSINGAQLFTAGNTTLPLAIASATTPLAQVLSPQGFNTTAASQARLAAFNQLRTQDLGANYIKAASHITDQAMIANQALGSNPQEVTVAFPNSTIGNQLKQVARIIKKRGDLVVNRQIFYVQIGSFDTHNNQIIGQGNLLAQFSQAARSFYDEMVAQGASNNVTLFSMSDFSRTLNPAGVGSIAGSDHAWANHMFVIGGAVNGGNFYGVNTSNGTPYPNLTMNGPDDADSGSGARGRWIPTTSVEQYASTLARWYGLPEADMQTVFPNYNNFLGNTNLGFMQP